ASNLGWTIQSTPMLPGVTVPPDVPPPPGEGGFAGISCASVDSCTAVGSESPGDIPTGELAEVWDGPSWSVIDTDTLDYDFGSQPVSVSCWAPGACLALGPANAPDLVPLDQYLGTTPISEPAPEAPATDDVEQLVSVSCGAASNCVGVGNTG